MKRLPVVIHGASLGVLIMAENLWVIAAAVFVVVAALLWHAYNEYSRGWADASEHALVNIRDVFAKRNAS